MRFIASTSLCERTLRWASKRHGRGGPLEATVSDKWHIMNNVKDSRVLERLSYQGNCGRNSKSDFMGMGTMAVDEKRELLNNWNSDGRLVVYSFMRYS